MCYYVKATGPVMPIAGLRPDLSIQNLENILYKQKELAVRPKPLIYRT